MRPLTWISCVFVLIGVGVGSAAAQSIDIRAGVNYTTTTGYRAFSFQPAYYFGVGKDIPISKYVSFRPELYYSLQGARRGTSRLQLHYIQMPLYFNFAIGEKIGIMWGPQVGILTRARYKNDRGETYAVLSAMDNFDLLVGGGPTYKISEGVKLELRLNVGTTRFDHNAEGLRNFVVQGGVVWSLNKPDSE